MRQLEFSKQEEELLKFLGFGVANCSLKTRVRHPVIKSIPYVNKNEGVTTPGVANWYASTFMMLMIIKYLVKVA